MALINCIDCGERVSDRAKSCPKCGCPIERRKLSGGDKVASNIGLVIGIIVGVILGWYLVVKLFGE